MTHLTFLRGKLILLGTYDSSSSNEEEINQKDQISSKEFKMIMGPNVYRAIIIMVAMTLAAVIM